MTAASMGESGLEQNNVSINCITTRCGFVTGTDINRFIRVGSKHE